MSEIYEDFYLICHAFGRNSLVQFHSRSWYRGHGGLLQATVSRLHPIGQAIPNLDSAIVLPSDTVAPL